MDALILNVDWRLRIIPLGDLWLGNVPRWVVMWALAVAIYAGFKVLTWRLQTETAKSNWRQIAYLFGWPGMDAKSFLSPSRTQSIPPPRFGEWSFATAKLTLGMVLFFDPCGWFRPTKIWAIGWTGMIGYVFLLHFGLFHLLSCVYRSYGFAAKPLMDWPVAATGVADFWGRRWNLAFRDLMHRFCFQPVARRLGIGAATLAGFLASGLIHELVMSVPAGAGYGGPTLYFLIQGLAVLYEHSPIARRCGLGRGFSGWIYMIVVLTGPLPVLVHQPSVERVFVPFLIAVR